VADDEPIIVVSGLPRSGTSLMMQVLQAGGVPLLTDGRRPADVSNPRGYFEYEKARWLAADGSWLGEARGRAVKVIVQLLPFLPSGPSYQVLLMQRDLAEVIRSQAAMLQALGAPAAGDPSTLTSAFERHLAAARKFLDRLPLASTETVDHGDLVTDPGPVVDRLVRFLGRPDLDQTSMIQAARRRSSA